MITAITQQRGDMPPLPDPVSVALEANVPNERATAMIRASWALVETWTGRNLWPVTGAVARARMEEAGEVCWPRYPYPAALHMDRWTSEGWEEIEGEYVPDFGTLDLLPGRYRLTQVGAVVPDDPPAHVIEAVRALALYQLIHSAARREFRTISASDSSLTREALDGLFRASGAGILLAGEVRW